MIPTVNGPTRGVIRVRRRLTRKLDTWDAELRSVDTRFNVKEEDGNICLE
jgi:hypothetical protein